MEADGYEAEENEVGLHPESHMHTEEERLIEREIGEGVEKDHVKGEEQGEEQPD